MTRIDQPASPKGRSRCRHDLLDGQCAWCKGLPDIPDADLLDPLQEETEVRRRFVLVEHRGITCRLCPEELPVGKRAAWSVAEGGLVCMDCAETDVA